MHTMLCAKIRDDIRSISDYIFVQNLTTALLGKID